MLTIGTTLLQQLK